jgi:hypothetical protein
MRCVQLLSAASNYSRQPVHLAMMLLPPTYERYHFGWIGCEVLRKLVVVNNEVGYVNVAIILLDQHILSNLISIISSDHAWRLVCGECAYR